MTLRERGSSGKELRVAILFYDLRERER